MARDETLLTRLVHLARSLDDDALASLASKGLVRRAQSDLESGEPAAIVSAESGMVVITIPPHEVRLGKISFHDAQCSCDAAGVCRHILAAALYLRTMPLDAPTSSAAPGEELLNLSDAQLRRWKGKPTLTAAIRKLMEHGPGAQIEEAEIVTIAFPTVGIVVRCLPGAGLDGITVTPVLNQPHQWALAGVLAYRRAKGLEPSAAEASDLTLQESDEAAGSREMLLAGTRALLEQTVHIGLAHCSQALRQRYATLAVAARGADLPRMSRTLAAISEHIDLELRRNVTADASLLLRLLARCYALATGLGAMSPPPPDLVQEHRAQFTEVGALELVGVGARAWQSGAGFCGLTVYFFEPTQQRWSTWNDVRPQEFNAGFDPVKRSTGEGPWEGVGSPQDAATHHLLLRNAKRSPQGRLSSSAGSKADLRAVVDPVALDFGASIFDDWQALREALRQRTAIGLRESTEGNHLVVIRPSRWGVRVFDQLDQMLRWEVLDGQARPLRLELPYDTLRDKAIRHLEALNPHAPGVWGVMGRAWLSAGLLHLEPYALYRQPQAGRSAILSLTVDALPQAAPAGLAALIGQVGTHLTAAVARMLPGPAPQVIAVGDPRLSELEGLLTQLAESGGTQIPLPLQERGNELARQCHASGLTLLAAHIEATLQPTLHPAQLLRTHYLARLHQEVLELL